MPLYIFECAAKLKMKPLTAACAAIVFHRFFKEVKPSDYDEFVSIVAATDISDLA